MVQLAVQNYKNMQKLIEKCADCSFDMLTVSCSRRELERLVTHDVMKSLQPDLLQRMKHSNVKFTWNMEKLVSAKCISFVVAEFDEEQKLFLAQCTVRMMYNYVSTLHILSSIFIDCCVQTQR